MFYQVNITTPNDLGPCDISAGKRPYENLLAVQTLLGGVANGTRSATVELQSDAVTSVRAFNKFTIAAGNLSAADTVTIQGTALTAVASGGNGTTTFNIGAASLPVTTAATQTAINLAACINANATLQGYVTASAAAVTTTGVVTITSKDFGPLSNALTLAKSAANGSITGATFAGGTRVSNSITF